MHPKNLSTWALKSVQVPALWHCILQSLETLTSTIWPACLGNCVRYRIAASAEHRPFVRLQMCHRRGLCHSETLLKMFPSYTNSFLLNFFFFVERQRQLRVHDKRQLNKKLWFVLDESAGCRQCYLEDDLVGSDLLKEVVDEGRTEGGRPSGHVFDRWQVGRLLQ